MIHSRRRTSGLRATLARTAAMLAVFAACAHTAVAQGSAVQDKSAAVRKLFEAAALRKQSAEFFEEMVGRYQKNWPVAVIASYREKNLFDGLTPGETAQMENLIREFGDRVFGDIKKRVVGQVITDDNLVILSAPVFDKYLDNEELARLTEFVRTPAGQKFLNVASRYMAEALLSVMEAKGVFRVSSKPEEDTARLDQLLKEAGGAGIFADVQKELMARAVKLPTEFTPDELRDLAAFWQTPLGAKLIRIYPPLAVEILQRNAALYAPRAGQIAGEVIKEQLEFFEERTVEILKDAGPRMKEAARRRQN
jgi:hypothetical protein